MTISTTANRVEYAGNGLTTAFSFPYYFLTNADLVVVLVTTATGAETVQTITTHYTVTGAGDPAGGTVTMVTAPASTEKLVIYRNPALTQEVDIVEGDPLPVDTALEQPLDRLTMITQRNRELIERALRLPEGDVGFAAADTYLPAKVSRANKYLGFDANGNAVAVAGTSEAADVSSKTVTATDATTGRTLAARAAEHLTPKDYGAAGDGTTNDTAKFSDLETDYRGAYVDMLGLTYAVTALPTNARYYNGSFRVGSDIHTMPRNPLAHPLDGDAMVIKDGVDTHYWCGPVGHYKSASADLLIGCYTPSYRHEVSIGAPLIAERSYDLGATWEDTQTIYSDASYEPRGLVGGMVTSSRFGVFFVLMDSAGAIPGTRFVYTDDPSSLTATWTTVNVGTTSMYPHGEFVIGDDGSLNVFGHGVNGIYRAKSTDNGATWTVTLVKASAAPIVAQPAEPAVVKIAANKYWMIVRNDAGGNAGVSTSTDLATWTDWQDSGLALGLNPPAAILWGGRLYIYLQARSGAGIDSWEDRLLYAEVDADATYANSGVPAAPVPLKLAYAGRLSMLGYLTIAHIRNQAWVGFLIDGEPPLGSSVAQTARLVKLGGVKNAVAAPAIIAQRRTRPPITHNPAFSHWARGTSFSGITTATAIAERFMIMSNTDAVSVDRVETTDVERKILPHQPRYAMRLQSTAGGHGRQICQRFYQKDRVAMLTDRVVTLTAYISGTLPGYFRFLTTLNFGGGGSATVQTFRDCAQRSLAGGITILTATIQTPNADGATWGTSPFIEFSLSSNDAGAVDCRVLGWWVDFGDLSIPLDPPDYEAERAVLDQYCQLFTFDSSAIVTDIWGASTSAAVGVLAYSPKIAAPSITLPSGTVASDFSWAGSVALTGLSFDLISETRARLVASDSGAGFTSGVMVELRSGGAGKQILVDVGH